MIVTGRGPGVLVGVRPARVRRRDAATRPAGSADLGRRMADAVERMSALTIAAIKGPCVGGGVVLAARLRPAHRRRRHRVLDPRGRPRHPAGVGWDPAPGPRDRPGDDARARADVPPVRRRRGAVDRLRQPRRATGRPRVGGRRTGRRNSRRRRRTSSARRSVRSTKRSTPMSSTSGSWADADLLTNALRDPSRARRRAGLPRPPTGNSRRTASSDRSRSRESTSAEQIGGDVVEELRW